MNTSTIRKPAFRKLRAYAFDPSLSLKIDTVDINEMVYVLPWEDLHPGPVGEYVEVIDYDPTISRYYKSIDLNQPFVLAEEGLRPSESNPMFHQQMVYAVAMTTIKNFEKALGRKILWSTRLMENGEEIFVKRLRLYPHALRDSNAYYSPFKKSILFGYFKSRPASKDIHMPNALVFTCLSHDIIAHEVTHAIIDGLYRHYNEPTNPDVLAFHEAFADIVALFQHFTFPEVLKHQIAKTRGNLESQNLLGQLAQEFGSAIGGYGSLRDALGKVDKDTKKWKPKMPNPMEYERTMEPHARGSILVAAVFDAFLNIYKRRVADLLRIATGGSGILPEGELHTDLVNRMAKEASKTAKHILNMCIRALDYCPPVDITFGDFLRAIITADLDLVKADSHDYRLAFIDGFRKRGIYPSGIKTLSIDSLKQEDVNILLHRLETHFKKEHQAKFISSLKISDETKTYLSIIKEYLKQYGDKIKYETDRKKIYDLTKIFVGGSFEKPTDFVFMTLEERVHTKFAGSSIKGSDEFTMLTGLMFRKDFYKYGIKATDHGNPSFQIQNLRYITRVSPEGSILNHIIFSIFQKAGVVVKDDEIIDFFIPDQDPVPENGFVIYGGCTLIFDLEEDKLKYVITKPLIDRAKLVLEGKCEIDQSRVREQFQYQFRGGMENRNIYDKYFGIGLNNNFNEPFAMLHRH